MSQSQLAFAYLGDSVAISASPVAAVGVQVLPDNTDLQVDAYLIYNPGTEKIYLGYATTDTGAQTNAIAISSSGTASGTLAVLPPESSQVIRLKDDVYLSAYCPTSTYDIFVAPGTGL